jgi:hypothetical protein
MSREHHKNLKRGLKQPLEAREQWFRNLRHGEPQKIRGTRKVEMMVTPGTLNATRMVEPIDPSVEYPAGTVMMDGVAIVHRATVEVPCWVPTKPDMRRVMKVAAGPTGTIGNPNTGGASAGKKSAKAS